MKTRVFALFMMVATSTFVAQPAGAETFDGRCLESSAPASHGDLLGGLLSDLGAVYKRAKDAAFDAGGAIIGYAGLIGIRYPVTEYQFTVSPGLTRGSRLKEPGFAALYQRGFRAIVDLTREGTNDARFGPRAGLATLNVKILDNSHPTNAQMKKYLDFITRRRQPAYVHCQAGKGRTGVAVAVYRMAVQGWSADRAIVEAKKFGMAMPNQEKYLNEFARDLALGKIAGYPLQP